MTAGENPIASVCIPTYRGAAFLPASIESVLNQSYPHFEMWIIDNDSPDDTQAVVSRYTDSRIRYLRNAQNLGPEGNFNRCLDVAKGKYFKLLPDDDLLAPDCLREQVAVLEGDAGKEIALVFGFREIIDGRGRRLSTRGLRRTERGRIGGPLLVRRCVRAGTNLIGEPGNVLFRRDLITEVGHYDATYPFVVDLDYWFRILLRGDAYYTATHASSFRISERSWSAAMGSRQYRDFKGFVDKLSADARFGLSATDRMSGPARARLNGWGRALIYRLLALRK